MVLEFAGVDAPVSESSSSFVSFDFDFEVEVEEEAEEEVEEEVEEEDEKEEEDEEDEEDEGDDGIDPSESSSSDPLGLELLLLPFCLFSRFFLLDLVSPFSCCSSGFTYSKSMSLSTPPKMYRTFTVPSLLSHLMTRPTPPGLFIPDHILGSTTTMSPFLYTSLLALPSVVVSLVSLV